jgi:hypothetical protein
MEGDRGCLRKIFVKFEHRKNLADDPATGQWPLLG